MEPDRRRWLTDALAAIIVAGALCLRVATPWEAAAPPPDLRAFALMILMGALLLVRRRYPLGVLLASVAILLSYYALGYGAVGAVWPVAPALFNAAWYGEVTAASISALEQPKFCAATRPSAFARICAVARARATASPPAMLRSSTLLHDPCGMRCALGGSARRGGRRSRLT